MSALNPETLLSLLDELKHARTKHPGTQDFMLALGEEYGELCKAILENEGIKRIREEAIQVATVALRIVEEFGEHARYKHDCESCVPIGRYHHYDLYFCPQEMLDAPTLIARFGSDGPDYWSQLVQIALYSDVPKEPVFLYALRCAQEKGLV